MNLLKENVSAVVNGLAKFFDHMIQTGSFNLNEFVNFMEPIFKAEGYRDADKNIRGRNILILTEGGAGDFISTTGAIRELRRLYPDARITLSVHPRTQNLAECCPYVDELLFDPQDAPSQNIFEIYKLNLRTVANLLEQRIDICFAFAIHPNTPLLAYMSGARIRMMVVNHEISKRVLNKNFPIAHLIRLATHLFPCSIHGGHHVDDAFAMLENLLHLPIVNRKLEIWYTPADVAVAKSLINKASAPLYALCMGGSGQNKHYPPEKYARLLEMILREEPTATFVILGGGKADLKSAEAIKTIAPQIYANNIVDLTGKITFRQSAAILSFCDMYIGNDNGAMHIAAAMNCPVLEPNCFSADLPLHSTDIPQCWYPYGVPSVVVKPKHALPECKNPPRYSFGCKALFPHCITQIEPETLLKGFHMLKERVAEKITEPLYIH